MQGVLPRLENICFNKRELLEPMYGGHRKHDYYFSLLNLCLKYEFLAIAFFPNLFENEYSTLIPQCHVVLQLKVKVKQERM